MQNNLDPHKCSVGCHIRRCLVDWKPSHPVYFVLIQTAAKNPEVLPGFLLRDLCVLLHFNRKPKVEKSKPDKEAEQQQAQKKKKGFLPETKKRQKRTKPVLEPAGEKPPSVEKAGAEKGQARKKNDKKTKRKPAAAGEASDAQPASAKKRKKQSDSKPAQKSQTASDCNPVKKKKKPKETGGQK